MSTATNVVKMPRNQNAKPALNLPGPRIWDKNKLAEFLGVSVSWVFKRTMANAKDPIPKIPGIGRLKFDTENQRFQDWMRRQLGLVDLEGEHD